jgi:hypothetical protein
MKTAPWSDPGAVFLLIARRVLKDGRGFAAALAESVFGSAQKRCVVQSHCGSGAIHVVSAAQACNSWGIVRNER